MNDFIILDRFGYGSIFNKIYIDYNKKLVKKECINSDGLFKLNNEINIYKFIINNNIKFPIPKIYNMYDNFYVMDYLHDYVSLYKIINNDNCDFYVNKIKSKLNILHSFHKKQVSKEEYYNNLTIEIETKIIERYDKIKDIVNKYNYITTVNGIEILSFNKLLYLINSSIYELINKNQDFVFVPIHGDCQFNNILCNELLDDIIFIDPRGYYGNSTIYGIPEYDDAKLLFALSGYDEFDNRVINELNIDGNELFLEINIIDKNYMNTKDLTTLLMLSIWLGNSHSFKNNEYKTVYSYFIALYFGSLYFSEIVPSKNL